jgi:hypothetical protein
MYASGFVSRFYKGMPAWRVAIKLMTAGDLEHLGKQIFCASSGRISSKAAARCKSGSTNIG